LRILYIAWKSACKNPEKMQKTSRPFKTEGRPLKLRNLRAIENDY